MNAGISNYHEQESTEHSKLYHNEISNYRNVVTFSLLSLALALHVRGPEGQVVSQQLHDQRRVLPPSGIGLKRATQNRVIYWWVLRDTSARLSRNSCMISVEPRHPAE
jgi:hypothetical protein